MYCNISEINYFGINLNNSTAIGNFIYAIDGGQNNATSIQNSIFKHNKLFNLNTSIGVNITGTSLVEYNVFGDYYSSDGSVGISFRSSESPTVRFNNIGGFNTNVICIGSTPSFSNNNFINTLNSNQLNIRIANGQYGVFGGGSYNSMPTSVDFSNNYWGNTSNIANSIFDYVDDFSVRGE